MIVFCEPFKYDSGIQDGAWRRQHHAVFLHRVSGLFNVMTAASCSLFYSKKISTNISVSSYHVTSGPSDWIISYPILLQPITGPVPGRTPDLGGGAPTALLGGVQRPVADEVAEEGEVLSTLGAAEPLLSGVHALVHLQVGGGGELLAAVGAGERRRWA